VTEHLELSTGEIIILITKGEVCQGDYCYDLGDAGSTLREKETGLRLC
jgi:hypothetical protein